MAETIQKDAALSSETGAKREVKLTKHDVELVFWRWMFHSHTSYNYERLQSSGVVQSMHDIPEKLYPGDHEKCVEFMKRHMQFYNTEPHFGGIINGLALAMEEEMANNPEAVTPEAITAVKTGLMGPMAGIGDTLWQGTLVPILLAIAISLGSNGSPAGGIFFAVSDMAIMLFIAHLFFTTGYKSGRAGVQKLIGGGMMKRIVTTASIMGAVVLGALAAQYVVANSVAVIQIGEMQLNVQTDILDKLLLKMLPLGVTLLTAYMLKAKQMKTTQVMLVLAAIGLVLGAVGFLG
jgi:mannose/fructose/N-acetylgalactosamine-specific phosphotransferase system component IID